MSAPLRSKIESAIADAKKDLESNDAARMKSALEKLTAVGGELYTEAQKAATPPPGSPPPEADGAAPKTEKKADVVDADFEVVDDDKNKKK